MNTLDFDRLISEVVKATNLPVPSNNFTAKVMAVTSPLPVPSSDDTRLKNYLKAAAALLLTGLFFMVIILTSDIPFIDSLYKVFSFAVSPERFSFSIPDIMNFTAGFFENSAIKILWAGIVLAGICLLILDRYINKGVKTLQSFLFF
jgi:hypothetical protein